jgi:hypothetical protein
MIRDDLYSTYVGRRDFLKTSYTTTLVIGSALTLEFILQGCTSLKHTRKDVINQKFECNPILPIPNNGCYTGTNYQPPPFEPSYSMTPQGVWQLTATVPGEHSEVRIIQQFINRYGITPTFHAIGSGRHGVSNDDFPEKTCRAAVDRGVIPVLRYVVIPFEDCYRQINRGKFDEQVKIFAAGVAKFQYPVVFVPFQLANDATNKFFPWATVSSGQYKDAWRRMHGIFKSEGANNAVWSSKMKMGRWNSFSFTDPFHYLPEPQYIDIVGWALNNHSKPDIGLYSMSFKDFFEYYYHQACRHFPEKPQMFWELSSARGKDQASWIDNALSIIPSEYKQVKGVMLDEQHDPGIGDSYGSYDPTPNLDSLQIIKKHFTSGRYLGSVLQKG